MKIEKLKIENYTTLQKWCVFSCLFLCFSYFGNAQETPKITSKVDTTFIKIGEQIKFKVTVDVDSTAQVIFPEGQTFSPLETVEAYATDTTRKKDRYTLQKIYALTQFDSGFYKLPAQRIEINGKGYFTDSLLVNVATVPVDTLNQKMYDIKELMVVEKSSTIPWLLLLSILLILLLIGGLLYWFVLRKKPLTDEEKVALLPPYDRAILELKKLDNSKYLIQDEYKEYYSELTGIVRSYLEEDVQVSALESTTDELISKLELMTDAGELELDKETLSQFKRILQTADLVKFARSKPQSSVAEDDRKAIENIVTKTHDAIPEPTEEELLEQAEYLEELALKKKKKKIRIITAAAVLAVLLSIGAVIANYGWQNSIDTVSGHPTKKLLENEWVRSAYGYPPIIIETPEVLKRIQTPIAPEAKEAIKEMQEFSYQSNTSLFSMYANSITLNQEVEPEMDKAVEQILKLYESQGAKNIITKQEEFTTTTGTKGLKVYGSAEFMSPKSKEKIKGEYTILLFGGKGFIQQFAIVQPANDAYATKIVERIVQSIEVKTEM